MLSKEKIDRINHLARKSKGDGLIKPLSPDWLKS